MFICAVATLRLMALSALALDSREGLSRQVVLPERNDMWLEKMMGLCVDVGIAAESLMEISKTRRRMAKTCAILQERRRGSRSCAQISS